MIEIISKIWYHKRMSKNINKYPDVFDEILSDYIELSRFVESVEVTPAKQELTVGESANLTVSITPSTATNQNVTWKSNDETILKLKSHLKIKF